MGTDSASRLHKRRVMRRKDARRLLEEAAILLGGAQPATVEQAEFDGTIVYVLDGAAHLVRAGSILFPTLTCPHLGGLSSVVVDMGAIPHVCNGADVMAPGVVEVRGDFEEGDLVVVRDERHGKALAVGRALKSSEGISLTDKGKVVENLHYVGDKLWKAIG